MSFDAPSGKSIEIHKTVWREPETGRAGGVLELAEPAIRSKSEWVAPTELEYGIRSAVQSAVFVQLAAS